VNECIEQAQLRCTLPLLKSAQFDHVIWEKPSHHLGFVRLLGGDNYLHQTRRATVAERRGERFGSYSIFGMEIKFDLFRRIRLADRPPPFDLINYGITTALEINGDVEFNAFREIYQDWRGLLKKLLEPMPITFFMSAVIPEVDRIRSKQPIPKLDAVMKLEPGDDSTFELTYSWHDLDWETGLQAFLVLAVLFTCVQKATAPRSRREHLLNYWSAISP